jgi:hypothetical protein
MEESHWDGPKAEKETILKPQKGENSMAYLASVCVVGVAH